MVFKWYPDALKRGISENEKLCHSCMLCDEDMNILKSIGVFICIIGSSYLQYQVVSSLSLAELPIFQSCAETESASGRALPHLHRQLDMNLIKPKSTEPWTLYRSWPCLIPTWHKQENRVFLPRNSTSADCTFFHIDYSVSTART